VSAEANSSGGFGGTYTKHLTSGDSSGRVLHISMPPLSREETGMLMGGVLGAEPPLRIVQHVLNRTKVCFFFFSASLFSLLSRQAPDASSFLFVSFLFFFVSRFLAFFFLLFKLNTHREILCTPLRRHKD
jgi:hypothetical protein